MLKFLGYRQQTAGSLVVCAREERASESGYVAGAMNRQKHFGCFEKSILASSIFAVETEECPE